MGGGGPNSAALRWQPSGMASEAMRRRSRPCTAPTGNSISSCEPCCAQGRALPEVARRSGARRHFHCEHVTKCPKCPNVGSQVGQNATTNLCGAPTAKLDIKTTAGGASTVSLASSPSLCLTAAVGMAPLNVATAARARHLAVASFSAPPLAPPHAVRGWNPGPNTALGLSHAGRPILAPSTSAAPGAAVFGGGNASFVELTLASRAYTSGEEQINGGFGFNATPPTGRQDFYAWFSCDSNGLYTSETGSSSLSPCGVGSNISITNAASVLTLLVDGKPVGVLGGFGGGT